MANEVNGIEFANKAIADSKTALANADKSNVSPRQSPYAPKHEYSGASYSAAHSARQSGGLKGEAESAAAGLAAKKKNVDDYVKASGQ